VNTISVNVVDLAKTFVKKDLPFELFSDLNFNLHCGDVLGIIGNNGSGKSTLLKIISGIIKPTNGKVELFGNLNSIIDLGQNFIPELTGIENIKLILKGQQLNDSLEEKIEEIIALAEIGEYIFQPLKKYSSGMLLRLGFAIYTSIPCDILVLDEIISVGDLKFRSRCDEIIQKLIKKGTTIIIATHDLETISSICNKTLLLHKGKYLLGSTMNVMSFYVANESNKNEINTALENEKAKYFQLDELGIKVELLGVKIISHKEEISYADNIVFEVQYRVNSALDMGITLNLFYKKRLPLLSSCINYDGNQEHTTRHNIGVYKMLVTIPGAILAPTNYSVDLSFHDSKDLVFKNYKSAITFTVEKDAVLKNIFNTALPPFPILPKLNWEYVRFGYSTSAILKDEKLIETLYESGFVEAPLVSREIIEKIRKLYFKQFGSAIDSDTNVISILSPSEEVRSICHHEIINLLKPYLDENFKNYKIILSTFFAKPNSEKSCVGFHQDPTFTNPTYQDDFTLWIPLEDIDDGDGEIVFIPYSHAHTNKINLFTYTPSYLKKKWDKETVTLKSSSGQALLFFNRTIHASKQNRNKSLRIAVSVKLCHVDAKIYSYYKIKEENKVERFSQSDNYYLNSDWDETKRPTNAPLDGVVDIY
jgi:ABC-2 type transport system ATP-binding protein